MVLQTRIFDKIPDRLLYSLLAWQYRSFDAELRHLGDYFPRDAAKHGTVVDVGAWWGPWTYWLSRKAEHVVTIEPVPHLAEFLRKVVADNVQLIECALSERTGVTELFVPTGGSGSEGRSTVEARVASGSTERIPGRHAIRAANRSGDPCGRTSAMRRAGSRRTSVPCARASAAERACSVE